jgi:hypothetical protein
LEGHDFSRCGEHKEFFSNLFSRCGKTQTSQPTEKIVILSGAGTSRSEVPAESKDPYTLSRPQVRQGILPVQPVFLAPYSEPSAKLRFCFAQLKGGL